jgi:hypothetical protein
MTKKQKERAANNSIGYGLNGNNLRLNVPKTIHPTGKNQRIYVGLRDTKENKVQVENLCLRLNTLLAAGQTIDWDNLAQYMPWKQHLVLVKPDDVKNIGWLVDSYYEMALKPTLKESTQHRYEAQIIKNLKEYRNDVIDNLREWLKERKSMSTNNLVFPSARGGYMDSAAVGKSWLRESGIRSGKRYIYDGVVLKLAKEGLIKEYVSAYHTRHTFISLAIESGLDTTTIADICGNSDSMVTQVYHSKIRSIDWNLLN